MESIRKAGISGLLAGTMLAAMLAGCGEKKVDGTAMALTINGETVNMGTAEFYLRAQQAESTSMMINYGLIQEGAAFWDGQYAAATSTEEAMTYGDNMKESSGDAIVEGVLLRQHMGEYGVEFPEDLEKASAEAAAQLMAANADAFAEFGTTEADVQEALRLMSFQSLMYDAVTADTDTEVSDEEAAQTTITYARASLKTTDSETNAQVDVDEAQKGVLHTELETLLAQVNEAGDPETDISALAKEIDEENITVSSRSYGSDDTSLPDAVKEAVKDLEDGQLAGEVIEADDYYYIVRLDKLFDEEKTEQKKESIVSQRLQDAFADQMQEWKDASEIVESDAWKALKVTDVHAYVQKAPEAESTSSSAADTAETSESASSAEEADSAASSSAAEEADSAVSSSSAEETDSTAASSAEEAAGASSASSGK